MQSDPTFSRAGRGIMLGAAVLLLADAAVGAARIVPGTNRIDFDLPCAEPTVAVDNPGSMPDLYQVSIRGLIQFDQQSAPRSDAAPYATANWNVQEAGEWQLSLDLPSRFYVRLWTRDRSHPDGWRTLKKQWSDRIADLSSQWQWRYRLIAPEPGEFLLRAFPDPESIDQVQKSSLFTLEVTSHGCGTGSKNDEDIERGNKNADDVDEPFDGFDDLFEDP